MSAGQRLAMLGIAAVIAVAAFLVLRPGTQEAPPPPQRSAAESPPARSGGSREGETPEARPKPEYTVIPTEDGEPVGGVRDIAVDSGETVRLQIRSNVPEEVHVHGYDRYIPVGPGRSGKATFKADLEGVYEVELHGSAREIASLRVEP